jgi:hypothetical protein
LLCGSGERHREKATSNPADERAPIDHSITSEAVRSAAILRLQEGCARVGEGQQLADKNRSMAAIERNALWPQVGRQPTL